MSQQEENQRIDGVVRASLEVAIGRSVEPHLVADVTELKNAALDLVRYLVPLNNTPPRSIPREIWDQAMKSSSDYELQEMIAEIDSISARATGTLAERVAKAVKFNYPDDTPEQEDHTEEEILSFLARNVSYLKASKEGTKSPTQRIERLEHTLIRLMERMHDEIKDAPEDP